MDVTKVGREQVATLEELQAAGLTRAAIRYRRERHWQEPLPHVFVLHSGPLTWRQRLHAALRYVGPGTQLTSFAALSLNEFRDAPAPSQLSEVDVLLSVPRKRRSLSYVKVRRTRSMPPRPAYVSRFPCAPLPRALADAFCAPPVHKRVSTGLLYEAVQRKRITSGALRQAFLARQVPLTAELTAVLEDLDAGAHSVAEGWGRRLIARSGLPQPLWNRDLYVNDVFLGRPDAYWPEHGVVLEINSVRHHQLGSDFSRTVVRQSQLASVGLCVIPVTPAQLRDTPQAVLTLLAEALAGAPYRGVTQVRVR